MKRPTKEIHNHNSIPGYYDGLEDGCELCLRNSQIFLYDQWLKENQQEMIDIHGMRHDVVVIEREGL